MWSCYASLCKGNICNLAMPRHANDALHIRNLAMPHCASFFFVPTSDCFNLLGFSNLYPNRHTTILIDIVYSQLVGTHMPGDTARLATVQVMTKAACRLATEHFKGFLMSKTLVKTHYYDHFLKRIQISHLWGNIYN